MAIIPLEMFASSVTKHKVVEVAQVLPTVIIVRKNTTWKTILVSYAVKSLMDAMNVVTKRIA